MRKATGALIQCALPIYYELCLDLLAANRAEEALQLCQYIVVSISFIVHCSNDQFIFNLG